MILLDTHVLLWCSLQHHRLGCCARAEISRAWSAGVLSVSAISFWEVAQLRQHGALLLAWSTEAWRQEWLRQGLRELPLDGALAAAAALEGMPQRAPFAQRCMVAAARATGATLITADPHLLAWTGDLQRLDAQS
ncbi:MAG: PIN domain-containing protein [Prochlorococcaceae cyanobacterium]